MMMTACIGEVLGYDKYVKIIHAIHLSTSEMYVTYIIIFRMHFLGIICYIFHRFTTIIFTFQDTFNELCLI